MAKRDRNHHLSRPILLDLCKDGTVTYRSQGEPSFNGMALPVFSVDTAEQAEAIQVRFCRRQYASHPRLLGKPWYRWTDFSGELDDMQAVTEAMHEFYVHLKGGANG